MKYLNLSILQNECLTIFNGNYTYRDNPTVRDERGE